MLKNKTKIIAIFLSFILLFSCSLSFADNETENVENSISNTSTTATAQLDENSYKKSDVYLSGKNVTIDYIVDGNVFVCADTVTINSQIGGDAFIMAKKLVIDKEAYVFSNLFTCAKDIEINGLVYDVYACADNITVSGYVYRDIKALCNNLNINGTIGRNAFVSCSKINFNTGDQTQSTNTSGIIYGDLNYVSSSESSIPEDGVSGKVNFTQQKSSSSSMSTKEIVKSYIVDLVSFLAFVVIVWLICLWLAPKFLNKTTDYVGKKTWGVLGTGLLTLVVIPIVCVILLLLQVTSSASLVLLALYFIAIALSKSIVTIAANNYVCQKTKVNKTSGIFGMLIASGIILWVLTNIPVIGGIISFIMVVLGLGILVSYILPKKQKNEDSKKELKEESKKDISDEK